MTKLTHEYVYISIKENNSSYRLDTYKQELVSAKLEYQTDKISTEKKASDEKTK